MIYAVDDEPILLDLIKEVLEEEGFEVATFDSGAEALQRIGADDPELIISDVNMPEMSGFEFKAALEERLPQRSTPFVFLSALSKTDEIVRGLDAGVDDYLIKPVDTRVLTAKVRSILSRKTRYSTAVFHGDLCRFPFMKVLQFCELQALSGELVFTSPGFQATVPIRAGNLVPQGLENADDLLSALFDLTEGSFVIHTRLVSFADLEQVAAPEEPSRPAAPAPAVKPMGRLSAVRVKDRLFQIQTELVSYPEPQVLTIVTLDGSTVLKRASSPPPSSEREETQSHIEARHAAMEEEVRARIDGLVKQGAEDRPSARKQYYELFDAGYEEYKSGGYANALALWEQAKALCPDDKAIEVNLRIVRLKLENANGAQTPDDPPGS